MDKACKQLLQAPDPEAHQYMTRLFVTEASGDEAASDIAAKDVELLMYELCKFDAGRSVLELVERMVSHPDAAVILAKVGAHFLEYAVQTCHLNIFSKLMDAGIDVNTDIPENFAVDTVGGLRTPILYIAYAKLVDMAVNYPHEDRQGFDERFQSLTSMIRIMLDKGADPERDISCEGVRLNDQAKYIGLILCGVENVKAFAAKVHDGIKSGVHTDMPQPLRSQLASITRSIFLAQPEVEHQDTSYDCHRPGL